MPDHLHVLIGFEPAKALADLVRDIKSDWSEWVNTKKLARGKFAWQEGYGAFSYGHSQLDTIVRYIMIKKNTTDEGLFVMNIWRYYGSSK